MVMGRSFPLAYIAQIWTQAPTTLSDLLDPNLVVYWMRYFGKDHFLRLPESMVLTAIGVMIGRTLGRKLRP